MDRYRVGGAYDLGLLGFMAICIAFPPLDMVILGFLPLKRFLRLWKVVSVALSTCRMNDHTVSRSGWDVGKAAGWGVLAFW